MNSAIGEITGGKITVLYLMAFRRAEDVDCV